MIEFKLTSNFYISSFYITNEKILGLNIMNVGRNVSASIGRKIAMLRKKRGISLSKLAEIAGISKSTLSAIEYGKINPTISTLWAIANALNVPFGELLPDELMEVDESGVTVRLIERSIGMPRIEVYKMVLKPMCVRKAEPHQRGVFEKVFVVSGSMISGPLSSPKLLKAGDEFEFRADVPHIYMASDDGAVAIVTVKYPVDDTRFDFIKSFPKSDAEFEDLRTLLANLVEESVLGIDAFRIELCGDYTERDLTKLKEILNKVKMRNSKIWTIERIDGVTIYIFGLNRRISIPKNMDNEAVKVLKLLRKQKLAKDELKYLENLVDCSSLLLNVLASEVLLAHGHPKVPKVGLSDPRILRPGYGIQTVFVASVVKRYFSDKIRATIIGDRTHITMLHELLHIEDGTDVLISFGSDFEVLQKADGILKDNGILIVSGDFVSPYSNRSERARNTILHHSRFMLETLVEINSKNELVKLLSTNVPLIAYLAEVGETERALSHTYKLYGEIRKLSLEISHPMESYYIFQRLELFEMIEGLNSKIKTYPERFKSIAEDMGFSLLYHARIYATNGTNDMDAGIHVFAFKREG